MENEVDDFLMHFGVKGMRWGRRKSELSSTEQTNSSGKKKAPERKSYKLPGTKLQVTIDEGTGKRLARNEAVVAGIATTAYVGYKAYQKIDKAILVKNTSRLLSDAATRKAAGKILETAKTIPYAKIAKNVYNVTTVR